MDPNPARRTLHAKRSFGSKHAMIHAHPPHAHHSRTPLDSPAAYDASEEDNDPLTDDPASPARLPAAAAAAALPPRTLLAARPPRIRPDVDDDAGTDSPTYDGDIESSIGAHPGYDSAGSTRYAPSRRASPAPLSPAAPPPSGNPAEPAPAPIAVDAFDPAKLSPQDIQAFVRAAIAGDGDEGRARKYRINAPPKDRVVRVYADGVYDLFHFGHALQLRQAKLAFPPVPATPDITTTTASTHTAASTPTPTPTPTPAPALGPPVAGVHLLVGVNSDEQCAAHKNAPVMNHAERCEAVRHCRWVDEVLPDAPWVIDEAFLQKHQIDYVAHDEDPYVSGGLDDVYGYCKSQGKFIPTRRTPGVSTSELLERIVSRYRMRVFDQKLARMGHAELIAEGSDWDGSAPASIRASRAGSPGPGR